MPGNLEMSKFWVLSFTPNRICMRIFYTPLIAFACLFLSGLSINAQNQQDYQLLLRAGEFEPQANLKDFLSQPGVDPAEQYLGQYFRIIQFEEIPTAEKRQQLESLGVILTDYLPRNAYFASIPANWDRSQLQNFNVRAVLPVLPHYKMTHTIYTRNFPKWALQDNGQLDINVSYYKHLDHKDIKEALEAQGAQVTYQNDFAHYFTIRIAIPELDAIAQLPYLRFIESVDPPSESENYTGRTLHRSNFINNDYATGLHYDGTGVQVMMQDDGLIGPHIDYEGRLPSQFVNFNNGDHGDHVAGIIMGAGNLNPLHRGNAPGADLYVYGAAGQGYPGFDSIPNHYTNLGTVITSTSYSNGCNAGYTNLARTMDQQVRTFPALMHVFSAGNSGTSDCGYGAGNTWGNVTGGHKIGKNVIAVANLTANDGLANSSSRGPAHDGRIKPDLSAKGTSVVSTTDINAYTTKTGTSMSCPGTSGTMAQLYQAYRDLNGNNDPEGGFMKAVMMNTADDLGNVGPDFRYGWGRINARKAYETLLNTTYMDDQIGQGGTNTHTINVPANTEQVRIMVYWTDYEASSNANIALVNDLDMVVTDPGSTTHQPWVLDHAPNATTLDNPATTGVDHLNNVEQVVINNPAAGAYTVTVDGFAVPQGPQKYFVVYEFITDEITLTYPTGGEPFAPFETEKIRWDAHDNNGTFMIEYTTDGGSNWSTIANSVAADRRYFDWQVPNQVTGQAMVRVTRNGISDESDAHFTIIRVPNALTIDYVCPDSLQISWNVVPSATGYEVSMLGQKYMDAIGTTTSNNFVVTGLNPFDEAWFSVKALGPNNAVGRRAIAIQKLPGLANCNIPFDASADAITSPQVRTYQECSGTPSEPIGINITNTGQTNIWDVPIAYTLNGGPIVRDTLFATINVGNSAVFTYPNPENFSVGSNEIVAWTEFTLDGNIYNDTTRTTINVITGTTVTLPYSEDFQQFANCDVSSNCTVGECTLAQGWVNEVNGIADDIDWRTHNGATPSQNSGPTFDHTFGATAGKYLYIETSLGQTGCQFQTGEAISPCIDLNGSTDPKMSFWYHMRGDNMGDLHVDVLEGNVWTLDVTTVISGEQGSAWQERVVDLANWKDKIINVRFRAVSGNGFNSDIAIDDVCVSDTPQADFTPVASGVNNLEVSFSDNSAGATTWSWEFGDGNTSTSQNPVHTYSTPGFYTVTLTTTNGCISNTTTQIVQVSPVGLEAYSLANNISAYPNPSNGEFQIEFKDLNNQQVDISILDAQGRLVWSRSLNGISNHRETVQLEDKANGIYILKVTSDNQTYQTKLGVF